MFLLSLSGKAQITFLYILIQNPVLNTNNIHHIHTLKV